MGSARGDGTDRKSEPAGVHVSLLGRFAVAVDGQNFELATACRRLVALLALRGPLPIARERAAGILWPDLNREQAAARLRTCLYRLGPITEQLVSRNDRTLCLAPEVVVDHFLADERGRKLCDPSYTVNESDLDTEAFGFELLPGWDEDWVVFEREAFQQLCFAALEAIASCLVAQQRFEEAIQACFLVIRSDPLRESAHRLIARAHAAEGNRAQALRQLEHYTELLEQEIGTQPSDFVIDLRHELLRTSDRTGGACA